MNCDVTRLREAIQQGDCQVVDVREYVEYAGGHVPGARNIPLGELSQRATELDEKRPIYVICQSGRRSAEAAKRLREMGFADVISITGGTQAWREQGWPLEREARAPWSLERQVRLVAGALVLVGSLASVWVSPHFVWLAAFVGAGLVFAAVTNWCGMALLLARLPWNRRPMGRNASAGSPTLACGASAAACGAPTSATSTC